MGAMLRGVLWICLILAVKVKARTTVTEQEKRSFWVNPHYDLCEEAQCLAVEDIFVATVDKQGLPCQDYAKYACNEKYRGSKDHEPFPEDPNQVLVDLRDILDSDVLDSSDEGNYALTIEKTIFKSCQQRGAFTAEEKQHYDRSVLPNYNANRLEPEYEYIRGQLAEWGEIDQKYGSEGFGFAFFDVEIYQPTNSDERYILIKPPPNEMEKITVLLAQRFMTHRNNAKHKKLSEFLRKLATPMAKATTVQNDSDIKKFTVGQWTNKYNSKKITHACAKINWLQYLNKLFDKVQESVRMDTRIAVQNEDYFYELSQVLSATNDVDVIVDYVHLHFVSKSIGLVDSNYRTYSALPQIDGLTCTPGLLAGTLYKYTDKYFAAESQRVLEVLTRRVKDTLVNRLQRAFDVVPSYLKSTLDSHVDKFKKVKIYFGYPAWLANGTNAYRLYGTKTDMYQSSRFYENQVQVIEQLLLEKLRSWKQSSKPIIDPRELTRGLESNRIQVNIETEEPEIIIPFGYFSEKNYKFFSSQLFDSVNYGAAATEIAFNLYYAIIDSVLDTKTSVTVPRCIEEQVPRLIRDRDEFAKKAVAYLLALETAYEALPFKHSLPIQFVDFGAMADTDVFFLSFAKSLCSIPPQVSSSGRIEEKEKRKSYRTDDYDSLSHYMKFALNNSKAFAENFLCKDQLIKLDQTECDPLRFEFKSKSFI